jgi:demethoxyubiquinone hydroxylase (CLK1/Coq7/Cat5 family)
MNERNNRDSSLQVFFDGGCPLCSREIDFYRKRDGADAIEWMDVSASVHDDLAPGLSRSQALRRFHVRTEAGQLLSGAAAFGALWRTMPTFRALGLALRWRPFLRLAETAYCRFLTIRPALIRWLAFEEEASFPSWVRRDLRGDHAGELGAVSMYQGILAVTSDATVKTFARQHLRTEQSHLARLADLMGTSRRSLLRPLWRSAGFLLGAGSALVGPLAVYRTIEAVETFVDAHYERQIARAGDDEGLRELCDELERLRLDEVRHREDAAGSAAHTTDTLNGGLTKCWRACVSVGSQAAVSVARWI